MTFEAPSRMLPRHESGLTVDDSKDKSFGVILGQNRRMLRKYDSMNSDDMQKGILNNSIPSTVERSGENQDENTVINLEEMGQSHVN